MADNSGKPRYKNMKARLIRIDLKPLVWLQTHLHLNISKHIKEVKKFVENDVSTLG